MQMMIHHMSFGVTDPERVAAALADLAGATAKRAPTPPFPYGAWFVLAGDDRGSFLEILPETAVFDPDAPLGLGHRIARHEVGNGHVLISTVRSRDDIVAVAEREGWRWQEVETGLFKIMKLWIDGTVLVELFAIGEEKRYIDAFGAAGMATLDRKLRELEDQLAAALAEKLPPEVFAKTFGRPDRPVA